jgi:UDP-glucose 4-epimerase
MEQANILIIGGAGYIGSHIAVEHLNKNHNVIIVDNLSSSEDFIIDNIKEITGKEFTFYGYDATNETAMQKVFEENKIDIVINMAGSVSNVQSIDNPIKYLDNNINILLTTLKVMRQFEVTKLVYGSSSKVYGKTSDTPISESEVKKLAGSPYAVSKQICEDILQTMEGNMSVAIMRYFNPIGCHSSGKIGCIPKTGNDNILNSLFESYTNKTQFIIKGDNYNTSDSTCIRDYVDIDDIVLAHTKSISWVIDNNENTVEAFNVATGNGISVKQIVNIFEMEMEEMINVVMSSRRKGGLGVIIGNTDKAKSKLNFTANTPIKNSINNYKIWYEYITNKKNNIE